MSDTLNQLPEPPKQGNTLEPELATATEKRSFLPRAHPVSWWMLVITTLAILMNSIDRIILPTLLPAIMKDFNISEVQVGWICPAAAAGGNKKESSMKTTKEERVTITASGLWEIPALHM